MSYLIDTNVVSELMRRSPAPAVLSWFDRTRGSEQWLSVITIGELRRGIDLLRRRDLTDRAEKLERAVTDIENGYGDRILPVTVEVVARWARLDPVDTCDGLIAATALAHGLTVVTRNVKHFAGTGAPVVDPFG